ncbi:MAG: transglycosylase SLT domain-containing protein [Acidobacteriota bacterium]
MRTRIAAAVVGVLLVGPLVRPAYAAPSEHQFDGFFRKYSKRFFGIGFDWRLFKAQGFVESRLDRGARSRAGARGVMQLLPRTYGALQIKNPDFGDIGDPQWNIAAGISYARDLWKQWQGEVDAAHQREFMLASYNAGRGTVLRAQRMAEAFKLDRRQWPSIELIAPIVPGWQYQETIDYVLRVFRSLGSMDARGRL